MVVDGEQVISLVSVHGRSSLSVTATFLCQLDSHDSTLEFSTDTECPVTRQWSHSVVGCQVCVFFEPLADWSLSFTIVCVTAVLVTCDVVHRSTWCFFSLDVLSLGCTTIERRVSVGLWYMCIRRNCSDNPATYGSPSIGRRGLLFVVGGLLHWMVDRPL